MFRTLGALLLLAFAPILCSAQPPTGMDPDKILDVVGTNRSETIHITKELIGGRRRMWVIQVTITDDIGRTTNDTIYPWEFMDKELLRIDAKDGHDVIEVDLDMDCWIYCGKGDDYVLGGSGDDLIHGEEGGDILFGGPGSDILDGGESWVFNANWLDGEEGLDQFHFHYYDTVEDLTYGDDNIHLFGSYSVWFAPLPPPDSVNKVTGQYSLSEFPVP